MQHLLDRDAHDIAGGGIAEHERVVLTAGIGGVLDPQD